MNSNYFTYLLLFLCVFVICHVSCENKYSRSANEKEKDNINFRTLDKPFRMNKLNILWAKAQHRITEPKLKSLYSDLMLQDKEELTLKRLKSDGGDKEGLKEAEIRRKLTNIMSAYGLREHFDKSAPEKHKEHAVNNLVKTFSSKDQLSQMSFSLRKKYVRY